jgi:PAS domain S-box-containing protein
MKSMIDIHNPEEQIRKLSQVVEQSPNMILITSLDGRIEYVNQAYCKVSGYCSKELTGQFYRILSNCNEIDEIELENLWETLTTGSTWRAELLDRKKNGELYWQGITINPILDNQGIPTHYVAIMQDITERKKVEDELFELNLNLGRKVEERASELALTNEALMIEIINRKNSETELRNAKEEAEKANKAKSEFISRMSHELRTPMNSILGFAQLLEMGDLNTGQRKGVRHILNSGKHLLKLINEVLDISKIEAGKLAFEIKEVNIKTAILEAIDLIMPLTQENNIEIKNKSNEIGNVYVEADKKRLIQVMVNLLSNAIKYNKKDGQVIIKAFKLKNTDNESTKHLKIEIIDTGHGIDPGKISRLFIPFERIDQNDSTIEGTGLGLSIAKELITAMGGTIGVESVLNVGSTFWIEVPYLNEEEAFGSEDSESGDDNEMIRIIRKSTILYIEDNIPNIELFEDTIVAHRPEIRILNDTDGLKATSLAELHQPDLILIDVDTTGLDVFQLLRELKSNRKTKLIPVVLISNDIEAEDIRHYLKTGADNILLKPLNAENLLSEIDFYRKKE